MNIWKEMFKYNMTHKKAVPSDLVQKTKTLTNIQAPTDWTPIFSFKTLIKGSVRISCNWGKNIGQPAELKLVKDSTGANLATFRENFLGGKTFDRSIEPLESYTLYFKFTISSAVVFEEVVSSISFDVVDESLIILE